jgi:hypothetical protein
MFADCRHKSTVLEDADSLCRCCEQFRKPDKITKLITSACLPDGDLTPKSVAVTGNDMGLLKAKIISISAARKSAEETRIYKLRQANFKYPMLECS